MESGAAYKLYNGAAKPRPELNLAFEIQKYNFDIR